MEILRALWYITGIVCCISVTGILRKKNKPKPICDTCAHLKQKNPTGEYYCLLYYSGKRSYRIPPEICSDYARKVYENEVFTVEKQDIKPV